MTSTVRANGAMRPIARASQRGAGVSHVIAVVTSAATTRSVCARDFVARYDWSVIAPGYDEFFENLSVRAG